MAQDGQIVRSTIEKLPKQSDGFGRPHQRRGCSRQEGIIEILVVALGNGLSQQLGLINVSGEVAAQTNAALRGGRVITTERSERLSLSAEDSSQPKIHIDDPQVQGGRLSAGERGGLLIGLQSRGVFTETTVRITDGAPHVAALAVDGGNASGVNRGTINPRRGQDHRAPQLDRSAIAPELAQRFDEDEVGHVSHAGLMVE